MRQHLSATFAALRNHNFRLFFASWVGETFGARVAVGLGGIATAVVKGQWNFPLGGQVGSLLADS